MALAVETTLIRGIGVERLAGLGKMARSNRRYLVLLSLLALAAGFAGVLVLGGVLAAPAQRVVGHPPPSAGMASVTVPGESGNTIAAWYVEGEPGAGAVLLLHGVRSNRREMLGRAIFLRDAGYSVLAIDLQAHGETLGEHITFGYRESRDVRAALDYLRSRAPGEKIGIIGVSLGGAAVALASPPVQADAVVLESVYSDIERAIENRLRLRLGYPGTWLEPLLSWQIEPRLGVSPDALSPIATIVRMQAPLFIISGKEDRHTLMAETVQLFDRAPEPKTLWLVAGAAHQNLHRYAGAEYERRILAFFARHLRDPDA
jgi:fermentation-respiration switch protein FrsA (DUF1100 family)